MKYYAVADGVESGSIAEDLGIEKGDIIAKINDQVICDYLDYKFLSSEEEISLLVIKKDGQEVIFDIDNEDLEDLGIIFSNMLFDQAKSCRNQCVFCFIDQLPKGMRPTLYFKDDDSRLSFLYGNYVTLTNMKDSDVKRLVRYRISPVNISVHTTDPDLRKKMLGNRFADQVLKHMKTLQEGNIEMNAQIVLCKGLNDGKALDRSIADLVEFMPQLRSVSVVPVGLSKYREGLYPLEEFNKEDCRKVIEQVHGWQGKLYKKYKTRLVYLSDEFYIVGEIPLPKGEEYEDFPQIENGVGLTTSLEEEYLEALSNPPSIIVAKKRAIATGTLAYNFINRLVQLAKMRYNKIDIEVYPIKNDFFGEKITVAGLICGQDIIAQLKDKKMDSLLITKSMLKGEEDIFLDDVTVKEVELALNTKVVAVENDGYDLLEKILRG